MGWYLNVLKNYGVFIGRARRKEYWMFFLVNIVIYAILAFIEGFFNLFPDGDGRKLVDIYSLFILMPSIAVMVRRLHDTNRSGWWFLMALVPIANIVLIVFLAQEGCSGSNQFGPNPKEEGQDLFA